MYLQIGEKWVTDSFAHEQSLVFDTEKGLVIFNSCSHGGADNIIREVSETFPGERIYALLGGFHLFKTTDDEVCEFAERARGYRNQEGLYGSLYGRGLWKFYRKSWGTV